MLQCTIYELSDKIIDTEYGKISYYEWLKKERNRISGNAEIRKSKGMIALWVDSKGLVLEDCKYHSNKL